MLAAYQGKTVVLGVRPENIATGGDVDVTVFSNENLGMNTLVHGRMMDGKNQLPITCKLRGWCDYKAGDHIQVQFEKRHFFDKETTNAIR
jgi:multiple sugar transport system ATP-binding protein